MRADERRTDQRPRRREPLDRPIGADPTGDRTPERTGGRRARAEARTRSRRRLVLVLFVVFVVSFAVRVWAPGDVTQTTDEPIWLKRSDGFRAASLVDGDLRHATAAHQIHGVTNDTMPGVTTLWAGTIGRNLADLAGRMGVIERPTERSAAEPDVLRLSRAVVALWCSLALVLFAYLATRLVGLASGIVAGGLLATEPWLAGLTNLLHTDAMVAMFSACSVVALAVALDLGSSRAVGRRGTASRRWPWAQPHLGWLVTSAAFAGLATLTKINALAVVGPGAAIVVLTALWHTRDSDPRPAGWEAIRRILPVAGIWLGIGLALFVVAWPAVWVAPAEQVTDIRHALRQIDLGHPQFFLGEVTRNPGGWFYPVTFAFRTTPWMFVGTVAAITVIVVRSVGALVRRPRLAGLVPTMPTWPVVVCLPYLALITWSPKKMDRYVSPLLPMLAILIGVLAVVAARALADRFGWRRALAPAAAVAATIAVVHCLAQAPYAISYVDPLLGQPRASRSILLGWGEGNERLGAEIARREPDRCDQIKVVGYGLGPIPFPCGKLLAAKDYQVADADYAVTYINQWQREVDGKLWQGVRSTHAVLVARTKIDGITYAQLWKVPH